MCRSLITRVSIAVVVTGLLVGHDAARAQFGIVLSGAGPTNRSMGGASTAAPLDASGAMYWNPAGITGLQSSELGVGLEVLYPQAKLSSDIPANAFAPGFPPVGFKGTTRSDNGVFLLPTVGLAYLPEDSCWAFGLGLFSAGGFAVNYPGNALSLSANPILTPPPTRGGLGVGPVAAELQVFQLVPTLAYRCTDRLSIGFAPTLSFAHLTADPAFLDPNADGSLASATNGRLEAGIGFQVGVYYCTPSCWHFGASWKSPQVFVTFRYNSTDDFGQPRTVQFRFNYPAMVSFGTAYSGFARWTLAADYHFINYRHTEGFEDTGFDPTTGAVRGLGWRSVSALAFGAQYELTPCTALRIGYTYNTNPIKGEDTTFNISSPVILQNTLYFGAACRLTERFIVTAGYAHAFENTIDGLILTRFGPIPGSSVESNVSVDTVMLGATVRF